MKSDTKLLVNNLQFLGNCIKDCDIKEEDIILRSRDDFMHIFSSLKDFRMVSKCTYRLDQILLIIFMAKIMEEGDSCLSIERYAKIDYERLAKNNIIELKENHEEFRGANKYKIPSHDTIRTFLYHFDSDELKKAFINRIGKFFGKIEDLNKNATGQYTLIEIDGQEFRGTGRKEGTKNEAGNIGTLNVYNASNCVCFDFEGISDKESEIPAAREILTYLNLKNKVITADALHTQRETAQIIIRKKGQYVFRVKDNQKELKSEIIRIFDTEKGITTIERDSRVFQIKKLANNYIGADFPGQKFYVKVTSKANKTKGDISYFVSNCKKEQLIIEAVENRWDIEGDFHKSRDAYFNEDIFRIQDKSAVQNIAIIHNILIAFFKISQALFQTKTLIETRKRFKFRPFESFELLTTVISSNHLTKLIQEKMEKKN